MIQVSHVLVKKEKILLVLMGHPFVVCITVRIPKRETRGSDFARKSKFIKRAIPFFLLLDDNILQGFK